MAVITFLVEDNKTIRDQLIPTLEDLTRARVLGTAETEAQAIHWLKSHDGDWDVAVVDLFLKEGSGLGVLRGCEQRAPHQLVVILSNYATREMRAQCLALGADAVFDKSTELDNFLHFVQRIPGQADRS
ncbi:response regulator [Variovorax sp. GB1R11]|uniref:response regulator n=1 Tax=Variovorax sp. GB1R11 TaxID=3443741 RepID=UPI003F449100